MSTKARDMGMAVVAVPLLAVLLLTGCGDDGGTAPGDQPTGPPSSQGDVGGY